MKRILQSPLTPLLNVDSPDPAVIVTRQGIHLLTSQIHLGDSNIQVYQSRQWQGPWQALGGALAATNVGASPVADHWAPDDPFRIGNKYRLYYAGGPLNGYMGIVMAESEKGLTDFRPVRQVVLPVIDDQTYATNIDPRLVAVDDDFYLFYGSMHQPIRCVKLAADGCTVASDSCAVLWPSKEQPHMQLLEGFYLKYHPQHEVWFAFTSGNNTWNKDDYAITLYSSRNPFGPYERLGVILEPSAEWWAPGQNTIAEIDGEWFLICHAVDPNNPYIKDPHTGQTTDHFRRVACVARMTFPPGACPELVKV